MQESYSSTDSQSVFVEQSKALVIINTIGLIIYIGSLSFGVYNMIRFRRHRSYPMGVFYVLTVLNLSLRSAYFIVKFFSSSCLLDLVLTVLPSSFSGSIGISQTMNYIVFSIRLNTYLQHKETATIS